MNNFSEQQYLLGLKALDALKPGGQFIYITCSAFYEENEAVIEKLEMDTALELESKQLITGHNNKADTLFVAVMKHK